MYKKLIILLFLVTAIITPASAIEPGTYNIPSKMYANVMFLEPNTNQWYSFTADEGIATISTDVITPDYYLYPNKNQMKLYNEITNKITQNKKITWWDNIRMTVTWYQMTKVRNW